MTETTDNTIKAVLKGLFHRYEALADASHPGWANQWRHRDELDRMRGRILDQVALCWPDGQLPDHVCVTHDHTVYRLDYTQGTLKAIATMPRHLPDETEIMQVIEVA